MTTVLLPTGRRTRGTGRPTCFRLLTRMPGHSAASRLAPWLLWFCLAFKVAALDTNKLSELKPPLPELPPTWWHAHGWQALGTTLLVFAVLIAFTRFLWRPKFTTPVPADVAARAALDKLRAAPDNLETAAAVGRHLRRYVQAALTLPSGETTTEELLRVAAGHPLMPAVTSDALGALLRECDARHFAAVAPEGASGVAARAMEIVTQIESARRAVVETADANRKPATP